MRPGLIATEIHNVHRRAGADGAIGKGCGALGRSGSVLEVAEVALWLCSGASSYVHGAVIDVSGGALAHRALDSARREVARLRVSLFRLQ